MNKNTARDMSKVSDKDLITILMSNDTTDSEKADAVLERDRRQFRKDFWTKYFVAWLALTIATASLLWQIAKELL